MTVETETVEINLNRFHECIETWIPNEREGYRLYLNEESAKSKPSQEYVLTQYSWSDEETIIAMGTVEIVPETPSKSVVNEEFEKEGMTPLSDEQWNVVSSAYNELCDLVLEDVIFDGVPQLYQYAVYHEISRFQDAMEDYIDNKHQKIERYEEYKDNDEKNYYEEYEDYSRLGDDQYHHIGEVLEAAISWEHEDIVPYAEHCQLAAILEFEPYDEWEVRTIEHLHNGILVNKPSLARTKALLEQGLTQSEIAEKLGKDPSTVSRQVSSITALEQRAEWSLQQVENK